MTGRPSGPGLAIVTGGSSGIGLETARILAVDGHSLALMARDRERLENARTAILDQAPDAQINLYDVDVGDRHAITAAVADACENLGTPTVAIANAGIAVPGLFLEQSLEDHQDQMATNYFGTLYFLHAVTARMAAAGGGRIALVASGAAFFGIYGYGAYAPTKFAVRGLAEVLRVELAPHGIGVTLCYPPDTDTPQLVAENRTKPAATKAITGGADVMQPEDVARRLVSGIRRGKFIVAPGAQMALLATLHSLLGPVLRFYQRRIIRSTGSKR